MNLRPPGRTGWIGVLKTVWKEIFNDHALMVAAGLAYYGVFGLLPAIAAAAALWGQFGDLESLKHTTGNGGGLLPKDTADVLSQFLAQVPEGFGSGLGLALNLLTVVFIAQRAASGLLTALNMIYDAEEQRGFLRRMVVALAVGCGGIMVLFTALTLWALPEGALGFGYLWLRWLVLPGVFAAGLLLLFRYAPHRDESPRWRWVVLGTAVAMVLWLIASAGVTLYVSNVGSYGKLYGSLGGVAIVLFWFYASALAVLTGAEVDAVLSEREQGRERDPNRPGSLAAPSS